MTAWRFVVEDALLCCADCGECLTDSVIEHASDCTGVSGVVADAITAERSRIASFADQHEAHRGCLECGNHDEARRAPCCPPSFDFAGLLRDQPVTAPGGTRTADGSRVATPGEPLPEVPPEAYPPDATPLAVTAPAESDLAHCATCAHRLGAGCGCGCCEWATQAMEAGVQAALNLYPDAQADRELIERDVREVFQAMLPHVRAHEAAAERERCAKLAFDSIATYYNASGERVPFTDLLRGGGDG